MWQSLRVGVSGEFKNYPVNLMLKRGRVLVLVGDNGKSLTCSAALGILPAGVQQQNALCLFQSNGFTRMIAHGPQWIKGAIRILHDGGHFDAA